MLRIKKIRYKVENMIEDRSEELKRVNSMTDYINHTVPEKWDVCL
jgi:hypothetical protein